MRNIQKGFWAYFILSLFFVNEISAKPVKEKKEKQAAPVVEVPVTETKAPTPSPESIPTSAPTLTPTTETSCSSWNRIQLGAGALFDTNGGQSGALSLTWNPTYSLASSLSLKGYFGGMYANLFSGKGFGIGDLGLVFKYDLSSSFSIEAGGGLQYWTGTRLRNTFSQIKAGIGFDPFIITYATVFDSLATTHQVLGALSIDL